jgi:hypothetical protein
MVSFADGRSSLLEQPKDRCPLLVLVFVGNVLLDSFYVMHTDDASLDELPLGRLKQSLWGQLLEDGICLVVSSH